MSNLFSSFDPHSWMSLSLAWSSSLFVILIAPVSLWALNSQSSFVFLKVISSVAGEFKAILSPRSQPAFMTCSLSLFVFILLNNSMGLLPHVFTSSSHLCFSMALALPLWMGHMSLSAFLAPTSALAHLVPMGTPIGLMPFMVLIEMVSSLIRPITLSVRLVANMIAGHLLLTLLSNSVYVLNIPILMVSLGALLCLSILECGVSMIQAYVFSVLSTLYLNEVNSPVLK